MPLRWPFQHANVNTPQEIQEMILLTLVRAEENGGTLSLADLARELNRSTVAIEIAARALAESNLIASGPDGTVKLSNDGREHARALLRRHRLAERLFTDVMGLDWARAHEEADKFEHVVTAQGEQQLATQLGDPETCPHGNPIPDARPSAPLPLSQPLTSCSIRSRATIVRIGLETPAALQHLATLGLLPSVEIEIEKKAPFDGPVLVRVGRAHYALGHDLAARIWVRASQESRTSD